MYNNKGNIIYEYGKKILPESNEVEYVDANKYFSSYDDSDAHIEKLKEKYSSYGPKAIEDIQKKYKNTENPKTSKIEKDLTNVIGD